MHLCLPTWARQQCLQTYHVAASQRLKCFDSAAHSSDANAASCKLRHFGGQQMQYFAPLFFMAGMHMQLSCKPMHPCLQMYYVATSRETKRLESLSRSPVSSAHYSRGAATRLVTQSCTTGRLWHAPKAAMLLGTALFSCQDQQFGCREKQNQCLS